MWSLVRGLRWSINPGLVWRTVSQLMWSAVHDLCQGFVIGLVWILVIEGDIYVMDPRNSTHVEQSVWTSLSIVEGTMWSHECGLEWSILIELLWNLNT